MFGRKAKELEEQLAQSKQEVAILAKKVESMTAELTEFKAKESAISGALTSAQKAAEKVLAEAEAEKRALLADAEKVKADADAESETIIAAANSDADAIIEEAKEKARSITLQAEAFMQEYRANAAKLNESLQAAAMAAALQADRFREFAAGARLEAEMEAASEYTGVTELLDEKELDLPDDYETPATLMQSIYAIENREIPSPAEEKEPVEEPEEEDDGILLTVNEIMKEDVDPLSEEEAGIDAELDAIINDVLKGS